MDKKEKFIGWLDARHVNFSISTYIESLERVSQYAVRHGLSKDDIWHIDDFKIYNKLRSRISSDRIFRSQNGEYFNIFEKYGKLYSDFLKYGNTENESKHDGSVVTVNEEEDDRVESYDETCDNGGDGVLIVDFGNIDSDGIAFSTPMSLSYKGTAYDVDNWNDLYMKLLRQIYKDSPDVIDGLNGKSIIGARHVDVSSFSTGMRAPKKIDGSPYYVESNLSATEICRHIAALLKTGGIDCDSVIVRYVSENPDDGSGKNSEIKIGKKNEKPYRPTWNIYEAAIMLDGYISSLNGQNADDICRRISGQLRQMAINSGHEIDEIYRNLAGIKLHMYTVKTIYNGDPNARSSALFSEIIRLYREERARYNEILSDAYKLCESDGSSGVPDTIIFKKENDEKNRTKGLERRRSSDKELLDATERILKENEDGVTREQIEENLHGAYGLAALDDALIYCHSVNVLGKYYIADNIYGFSDMADILLDTILKQFASNGGFTTAIMLYKSVKSVLDDFFFYNRGFDSWRGVYDLCVYLFKQEKYMGYCFVFQDHINCIWREEPEYEKTYYGLLLKHVKDNGGKFKSKDAIDYLDEIGCKSSQSALCRALSNSRYKDFVQYDADCYILAESVKMDESFCDGMKARIELLLGEEDYVTFGSIEEENFYAFLPSLPDGIAWNAYMIRSVLNIKDLGYAVLDIDEEANRRNLPSVILRKNSQYETLPDIIWAEIDSAYSLPKTMDSDEFRLFLVDHGFMRKGDRSLAFRNVVRGDRRFLWTNNDGDVIISQ